MAITRLNPEGLHETPGYAHVTVVDAGRLAFLAGQCPLDADGVLAGPGLATQTDQVAANALAALSAVGAGPEHVVRTVIYVVTSNGDDDNGNGNGDNNNNNNNTRLGDVWRRLLASPLGPAFTTASTLLGVARLGFTGQLVELDVTAALPD
jgi:enamine deaminase RidA (YjgF/YER057c/UK114 family)